MSDEWKALVVQAMSVQKISRADLARELGVTRGLITKLLKPASQGGQQVSALVPRLSTLLKIPMPHGARPIVDERRARLDEVVKRLSDEKLEAAIHFLEAMVR
jgi:transposase-like protein